MASDTGRKDIYGTFTHKSTAQHSIRSNSEAIFPTPIPSNYPIHTYTYIHSTSVCSTPQSELNAAISAAIRSSRWSTEWDLFASDDHVFSSFT